MSTLVVCFAKFEAGSWSGYPSISWDFDRYHLTPFIPDDRPKMLLPISSDGLYSVAAYLLKSCLRSPEQKNEGVLRAFTKAVKSPLFWFAVVFDFAASRKTLTSLFYLRVLRQVLTDNSSEIQDIVCVIERQHWCELFVKELLATKTLTIRFRLNGLWALTQFVGWLKSSFESEIDSVDPYLCELNFSENSKIVWTPENFGLYEPRCIPKPFDFQELTGAAFCFMLSGDISKDVTVVKTLREKLSLACIHVMPHPSQGLRGLDGIIVMQESSLPCYDFVLCVVGSRGFERVFENNLDLRILIVSIDGDVGWISNLYQPLEKQVTAGHRCLIKVWEIIRESI